MLTFEGEEVVISGISGRYPESDNIYEFWELLVNGMELNSVDDRRWPVGFLELPPRSGRIKNADKFDAQFFEKDDVTADSTDPQLRIFYEVVYEAIIDAGIIPENLRGSNTAVLVGMCYDDTNSAITGDSVNSERRVAVYLRDTPAIISQFFGFTGPVFEMDSACASSFSALFEGLQIMKSGTCDKLIIGGSALHLTPNNARGFLEIKMISPDGRSKCLDASVDGYCRSEAVVAMFVEKKKDAKRIYASIEAIATNTDGFKPEGITFPRYETQKILMQSIIKNSGLDPLSINYIEAHITGTAAGDTTESHSIIDAYRKDSEKPLMFGCLKSNMGHTEGASTNCALTKVALIFQKHCIPPNLNYKTPNPNIPALVKGQIVPVLKKTEFHDEIIPVNSFGFGGVNVHALLKANEKVVTQDSFKIIDNIPRLVNISGRTEEGLEYAMNWIENNRKDVTKDFLALLNDVSKTPLESGMHCRAFMILNKTNVSQKRVFRQTNRRPLWFVFSALGCQWKAMTKNLMNFPIFAESIHKCAKTLKTVGVDLINLLTNEISDVEENIVSALVSIVSIQIAIVDVLYFVDVKPDGIVGHSIGEVVAGYAAGCLTVEEAVLTGYYIAKCSKERQTETGAMAAVGLSWEDGIRKCPSDVYPACDNSEDGITVSGLKTAVTRFVKQLEDEKVFAKVINSCEMAYHCPLVDSSFNDIASSLAKVIQNPKLKSSLMISTSSNEEQIYCDANYYAHNVVSPVMFRKALLKIPEDACVIEVGPSALLLSIVKRCISSSVTAVLMKKDNEHNDENILAGMGQIYCTGNNINIEKLYPKVEYPVPRETLSLSHLVQWDHSNSFLVTKYPDFFTIFKPTMTRKIDFTTKEWRFTEGHCIDGRILFPATGYLYHVWYQYTALMTAAATAFIHPVEFRNVRFNRATIITKSATSVFDIYIDESSGRFSVIEGGSICVTGHITFSDETFDYPEKIQNNESKTLTLTTQEIYRELRVRGYDYGQSFQGLDDAAVDGSFGKVKWNGHWITFTDTMLHLSILASKDRLLKVPTEIEYLRCDPTVFYKAVEEKETLDVSFNQNARVGYTDGIFIKGMNGTPIQRRTDNQLAKYSKQFFAAYYFTVKISTKQLSRVEEYFEKCTTLLQKLASKNWDLSDIEEKSDFNIESNEGYSFYKRLIVSLKENENFSAFFENLTDADKTTLVYQSNCRDMFIVQLRQIIENLLQNMNIVEFNETESKLEECIIDSAETYLMKYEFHSLPKKGSNDNQIPPSLNDLNLIIYKDVSTELITDEKMLKNKDEISSLVNSFHKSLKEGGFLLFTYRTKLTSLEQEIFKLRKLPEVRLLNKQDINNIVSQYFIIIGERSDDFGVVSCILKKVCKPKLPVFIKPNYENYDWVDSMKSMLKENKDDTTIWLTAKESDFHGVIGLIRCLKKEPGGERFRCFVSEEETIPEYVFNNDLVVNYFKKECYGVYIHLNCDESKSDVEHSYLDIKTKGDLSSFQWYEAPHKNWSSIKSDEKDGTLVNVYYGALNFKDVMVAAGRIPLNAYPQEWHLSGNLGMEYSGIDENGNRVMGIAKVNSIATSLIITKGDLCWSVPSNWSLEEAATVPVVYVTVYYALIRRGNLQPKEKVLIHAGSGGIGQAAIAVCLSMDCEVFTTVGTDEKKHYLKNIFPELNEKHILNSRDLSFEENVLKLTNGEGVDVILNSLAEEKLRASINCLADFGRFIEIGKYDIIQNNCFDWTLFDRNKTFHSVCVAHLIADCVAKSEVDEVAKLQHLVFKALQNGKIKPLNSTVFAIDESEKAFRFMASGKHIGKVLMKIRDENIETVPKLKMIASNAQTYCHPSKVYIVFGGLGGLGLELAIWLSHRGARKLVLTSRTGIKDNYQRHIINQIEAAGVTVKIVVSDASTYENTRNVIDEALELGIIGGIFNLAMVLNDALIENQTPETFKNVCVPKINTTLYADQITRKMLPELDYFVCFSSLACGGGNAGQSNYGFANSVMENICEKRREDGLHGVAIQWGPVGDTGFFIDFAKSNDVVILGRLPQRIPSLMNSLNTLLNSNYAVCSSSVVASKSLTVGGVKGDLLKTICHILGISDLSTFEDTTTLVDLGMDSLMAVEIKQGLEREYNTVLSTQEIRQLTIKEIKDISKKKVVSKSGSDENEYKQMNPFVLLKELFIKLDNNNQGIPVFFIPPIEGDFKLLQPLVKYMSKPVVAINWTEEVNEKQTIEEIASFYVQKLRETYPQSDYEFVAYSFGAFVAFEMCLQLQAIDKRSVKKLILLDGDIETMRDSSVQFINKLEQLNESDAYRELFVAFMSTSRTGELMEKVKTELDLSTTKEEMLNKSVLIINSMSGYQCDAVSLSATIERYLGKMKRAKNYKASNVFDGIVKFICSTTQTTSDLKYNDEDHKDMKKLVKGVIDFIPMSGDHTTFLTSNFEKIGNYIDTELYCVYG